MFSISSSPLPFNLARTKSSARLLGLLYARIGISGKTSAKLSLAKLKFQSELNVTVGVDTESPSQWIDIEATRLKSSGLTSLHNLGKSKLIVTDVGLTNLMESIAQQMQWVLGLRYYPRLIRCPNHDHCSCINLVSWILLSKISNRPIKLKSLTVSRFTFMLDHVI